MLVLISHVCPIFSNQNEIVPTHILLKVIQKEYSEIGSGHHQLVPCLLYTSFESFTFKKLAQQIETTEASVYRYFENKHRLLLYIINLYWSYLEYLVTLQMPAESSTAKLKAIIQLLTHQLPDISSDINLNKKALHEIVVSESSKTYLVKEINEINKAKVFQPYKDLCKLIADVIKEIKREYVFPHSLASTILETAHAQEFFIYHLPGLTDFGQDQMNDYTEKFLLDLVSKTLDIEFI